jgi:polyphosphate kinase
MSDTTTLIRRDLARLAFSARLMQEAEDPSVPLYERLHMLARATCVLDALVLERGAELVPGARRGKPGRRLRTVRREADALRRRIGTAYRSQLLPALERRGIRILVRDELDSLQRSWVRTCFEHDVVEHLDVRLVDGPDAVRGLRPGCWLAVSRRDATPAAIGAPVRPFGLVSIPRPSTGRFAALPEVGGERPVIFLDDVIRANLDRLFPEFEPEQGFAIWLASAGEAARLGEMAGQAPAGIPGSGTRLVHDRRIPFPLLATIRDGLGLDEDDLVPGGRYPAFGDLVGFPRRGLESTVRSAPPPLARSDLEGSLFDAVAGGDRLLRFPFESFEYLLRFLREAADDPDVRSIRALLSRPGGAVARVLGEAARAGRNVTAVVGHPGQDGAEALADEGVRVVRARDGLDVASDLVLVDRDEVDGPRAYACLATGRLDPDAALRSFDYVLLTADRRITKDTGRLLDHLEGRRKKPRLEHLLVAPRWMKRRLKWLLRTEELYREADRPAGVLLNLRALEHGGMARRLARAALRGVPVAGVVYGACRVPSRPGLVMRSIVDRYVGNAGIWWFTNGGDPACYLSSVDWTRQGLRGGIGIAFPVFSAELRVEIRADLDRRLSDNVKARIIDSGRTNPFWRGGFGAVRSEDASYRALADRRAIYSANGPAAGQAPDKAAPDEAAPDEVATDGAATDEAATDEAATERPGAEEQDVQPVL